jgi:hypothetical protein
LEHVGPVVLGAGVQVHRVKVDERHQAVDHLHIPIRPTNLSARHEPGGRVEHLDRTRPAGRFGHILFSRQRPHLPAPVHLVPEPPPRDFVRLGVAIVFAPVGPIRSPLRIAVFDPLERLFEGPRPHVETDVWLDVKGPAILDELVYAEAVAVDGAPSEIRPSGTKVLRAQAVFPVVIAHEVATRPAQHG